MTRATAWMVLALASCQVDPIELHGQFGRAIPLATGDASPLPRLAFIDEGCPGDSAAGGCPSGGERECQPLVIDSLAPITALKDTVATQSSLETSCLEVRPAAGLAAADPSDEELDAAVTRFRFDNVPLIRAPGDGSGDWNWVVGESTNSITPAGVIGGNLLRSLAVRIKTPRRGDPSVTFYSAFPGTEKNLADDGRAYLPLQFPGRLLGRAPEDRCELDGDRCELDAFAFTPGQDNLALLPTRMVMDACVAAPPCTVWYQGADDPFAPGTCDEGPGPGLMQPCVSWTKDDDTDVGGETASLVVATGVQGMVLFSDSVQRMFGTATALPGCTVAAIDTSTQACLAGIDGELHIAGWPSAGETDPLVRLRVRSVALVPGGVQSRDVTPCERGDLRRVAALDQCERFTEDAGRTGDIRDTFPPFSATPDNSDGEDHEEDAAATSVVVLGEASFPLGEESPDPDRWIDVTVLPATHPLVTALRRDVSPEAVQPDGLLGTVLLDDTDTILDYTDPNPGVRVSCVDPRTGDCYSAPECRTDGQPACCFGMPLELIVDWIVIGDDDTCCGALSAEELAEVLLLGHCQGLQPP